MVAPESCFYMTRNSGWVDTKSNYKEERVMYLTYTFPIVSQLILLKILKIRF